MIIVASFDLCADTLLTNYANYLLSAPALASIGLNNLALPEEGNDGNGHCNFFGKLFRNKIYHYLKYTD